MTKRRSPIAARLDEMGQTQAWLARESGVPEATLSRIVNFKETLTEARAQTIARVLDVSWTELWAVHHDADHQMAEFVLLLRQADPKVRESVLTLLRIAAR
jgi:plasmid maintenance system antidote protein VapI